MHSIDMYSGSRGKKLKGAIRNPTNIQVDLYNCIVASGKPLKGVQL